ncbi:MAG: hypothetical protein AAGC68_12015, partial [Verrucomicrobiota bacterium]
MLKPSTSKTEETDIDSKSAVGVVTGLTDSPSERLRDQPGIRTDFGLEIPASFALGKARLRELG